MVYYNPPNSMNNPKAQNHTWHYSVWKYRYPLLSCFSFILHFFFLINKYVFFSLSINNKQFTTSLHHHFPSLFSMSLWFYSHPKSQRKWSLSLSLLLLLPKTLIIKKSLHNNSYKKWVSRHINHPHKTMAEDWDLNAVVRSCKSAANKTASLFEDEDETLSFLASLTLLQDQNNNNNNNNMNQYEPTNDNNNNAFQELQQFFSKPTFPHNPTTASKNTIILNSLIPDHLGVSSGQQNKMQDHVNGVVFSPQPQQVQQRAEAQKNNNNRSPVLLRRPVLPGYDASPDHPSLLLSTITRPIRKRFM